VQKYFEKFSQLIRFEMEDELKIIEEQLNGWSQERLAREGLTLFRMRATPSGRFFGGDALVRLRQSDDRPLRARRFDAGLMVVLSRHNPLSEEGMDGAHQVAASVGLMAVTERKRERDDAGYVLEKNATSLLICLTGAMPGNIAEGEWVRCAVARHHRCQCERVVDEQKRCSGWIVGQIERPTIECWQRCRRSRHRRQR
jgi:hypothetical protein